MVDRKKKILAIAQAIQCCAPLKIWTGRIHHGECRKLSEICL